jgi:hypothetical protein
MNDPDYAKKLLAQDKTTEIELTKAGNVSSRFIKLMLQ